MTSRKSVGQSWKGRLKKSLKLAQRRAIERFLPFNNADLAAMLMRLGVRPGDVLLVHSSYSRFQGFTGKPRDVIDVLQEAVGPSGTVIMPTLPFTGSAVNYARKGEVTDLEYSPSSMGLVTEVFRRTPGVVRSVHPTHTVAAAGPHTKDLIRDHHLASTPCGQGTPYLRLLDVAGKVLFLGASVRAMTFYHGLEELLEPELPVRPFTEEVFDLQTRDLGGVLWNTRTRLFSSVRRDSSLLVPVLKQRQAWHEQRVGVLPAILIGCRDILDASRELARLGKSIYPSAAAWRGGK